ncbi:MAG: hypothetical protein PHX60_10980 [Giesbergeria sp.]|uniref:hypothetical protein n=1 Tax=Giesbergeria sp. TaxID=2818473 RepID=UPI002636B4C9|nr:hypothetical protein [Giesbergeria sp.]MDD2610190.1 hypothetical protein [Giesbergeria sp.]
MSSSVHPYFFDALPQKVGNRLNGVPIPHKRSSCGQTKALPPQVRDLAELLAQIAADEFLGMRSAHKEQGQ